MEIVAAVPSIDNEATLEKVAPSTQDPQSSVDTVESIVVDGIVAADEPLEEEQGIVEVEEEESNPPPGVTVVQVGREYRTEPSPELKNRSKEANHNIQQSGIPEKDVLVWEIADFSAFRKAAKTSKFPPLMSPAFGNGCHLVISSFDRSRRGHVTGHLELPFSKATRNGVVHLTISVTRPDSKRPVLRTRLQLKLAATQERTAIHRQRRSGTFRLSSKGLFMQPRWEHLLYGDTLHIRIELQYFPFDAPVFVGSDSSVSHANATFASCQDMLADIRQYCADDPLQSVEVKVDDKVFHSCRFLLCARSSKFRNIFSPAAPQPSGPRLKSISNSAPTSVTLTDISPEVLDQLLTFIHSDSCSWLIASASANANLLKQLDLLEAANLYGVAALSAALTATLASQVNSDNFVQLFEVADREGIDDLKKACTNFMDSMPGSRVALMIRNSGVH